MRRYEYKFGKSDMDRNNRENGSFGNRENLQYKKTADSVLLSLFMRTMQWKVQQSPPPPPAEPVLQPALCEKSDTTI